MSAAIPVAKLAIHLVSSAGVSKVINDVIRNNTDVVTTADAVKVAAGSLVIGSMIAEHAAKHVNARLDSAVAWYQSRKDDSVTE